MLIAVDDRHASSFPLPVARIGAARIVRQAPYNIITWNCHDYAQGMLEALMQPRPQ
jgi:hypothetical protein